ncbi:MAG TPA: cytochrome ubiquinol oxidase subunit I [Ktedonobacteraceae bacterium]|jgi:cytochrome d ubiquinol oxidase subunit I|nr:cytochrome ubiquinol oxidase subunit I [Ktedonobacteraceae bacterium]
MFTNLLAARAQMGTSLAFHIIFAALGVGLPLLICIAEGLALWKRDGTWMALAHQWTRAFAILFAIGAVSGAIIEFELSLLWPTFTRDAGAIIGLPFALEGFAFFIEGIFLGIYIYGAKRLSPLVHWLCSLPIVLSGLTSAWFVVSANSWMNSPAGFQIVHGKVVGIDPFQAILNPSTPYETTHMILACYVTAGFGAAAVYAMGLLRGKRDSYHRKGLVLALALGLAAIPFQIISGDFNARFLESAQPTKYAAMEGVWQSGSGKPLYLGGIVDQQTGQISYAIEIPYGESLIAHFDIHSFTRGLDSFPAADRPDNVTFVHLSFDGMVLSGFFTLFVGLVFWFLYWRRKWVVPQAKWLLYAIVIAGPAAFLALELGWMVTEAGRQPWVIYGLLRTSQAVTPAQWMNVSFLVFSCIYILLGITLVLLLLALARRAKPEQRWPMLLEQAGGAEQKAGAS